MSDPRDLVIVADAHLGADDPEVPLMCEFLRERSADASEVVLLGDIFGLWLGVPKHTLPHQHAVLETCRDLRRAGVRVVFIEGNREFGVATWRDDAFDAVVTERTVEAWGGRRWLLAHGDTIDPDDRSGRAFRALTRSSAFQRCFFALPRVAGQRLATRLERALRHRNITRKTSVPRARLERYGAWLAERGYDAGAIGHIHVEMTLDFPPEHAATGGAPARQLFVLPDWRTTHRYLRVRASGPAEFVAWREVSPPAPAIVHVTERGAEAELTLDRDPQLATGVAVRVAGGHGPEPRKGRVARSDGAHVWLRMDPGPPLQVGDRVYSET